MQLCIQHEHWTVLSLGLVFCYMEPLLILESFYIQWMNRCIWSFWNAIKAEV